MSIVNAVAILDQLQSEGVIDRYAIGGATAANFHLEPFATFDVDVFLNLEATLDQPIITMTPILSRLASLGCHVEGEHVVIAGVPVQFPPLGTPLVEEALREAVVKSVGEGNGAMRASRGSARSPFAEWHARSSKTTVTFGGGDSKPTSAGFSTVSNRC
jgi:hypothetical protein